MRVQELEKMEHKRVRQKWENPNLSTVKVTVEVTVLPLKHQPRCKNQYFMLLNLKRNIKNCGGERGIRTPGTVARTVDFESTAFNRSAISPTGALVVPAR